MSSPSNPVKAPAGILSLLDRLHAESSAQEAALGNYLSESEHFDELMRDKSIALDQDKCHFVYQICRAIMAKNVVEVGTSFGVSTMYLALAVGGNAALVGKPGKSLLPKKKAHRSDRHGNFGLKQGNWWRQTLS